MDYALLTAAVARNHYGWVHDQATALRHPGDSGEARRAWTRMRDFQRLVPAECLTVSRPAAEAT